MTVVKVEIEEPDGLPLQSVEADDSRFRLNPSCFEWQFVHVDNEVVAYHATQPISGLVEPIPPAGYNWSVVRERSIIQLTGHLPMSRMEHPFNDYDDSRSELRPVSGSDACLQTRT